MLNAFVIRSVISVGFVLITATVLPAQILQPVIGQQFVEEEWARAMVEKEKLNINFKSVAKGQDVAFKIRITNKYQEDMQITSLITSCGCIGWEDAKPLPNGVVPLPITVLSGEEKFLTLRLDTIRHPGEHKAKKGTITFVNTANGVGGTATINVEGYVRTDVVLQPGSVNFGAISLKTAGEQRLTVNYAGRNDWRLISAKCNSPHIETEIVEKSRGNGLVNYELVVKLRETAPVGVLRDQLMLVTDDANNPQIPVQVDARIEPDITVSVADFGPLTPGKPKEKTILVRYTKLPPKPFKIEKFERTRADDNIRVKKSDEMKAVHQMTLTFTPPNQPGLFEEDFYLTVSGLGDQPETIVFKAKGRILPIPGVPPVK